MSRSVGAMVVVMLALALGFPSTMARDLKAAPAAYFIFGYGSLLSTPSTQKTNCALRGFVEGDLEALTTLLTTHDVKLANQLGIGPLGDCNVKNPRVVRINGLQRGFYAPVSYLAPSKPYAESAFNPIYTALGAYAKKGSIITGLIYEVNQTQYENTLAREKAGGYTVGEVNGPDITVLGGTNLPKGATIAYFASPATSLKLPTAQVPSSFSYIDIFLGGAFALQDKFNLTGPAYVALSKGKYGSFVEETIKTTGGWNRYILNDRIYPLRPFVAVPAATRIDDALWKYVKHDYLKGVRFPGQAW